MVVAWIVVATQRWSTAAVGRAFGQPHTDRPPRPVVTVRRRSQSSRQSVPPVVPDIASGVAERRLDAGVRPALACWRARWRRGCRAAGTRPAPRAGRGSRCRRRAAVLADLDVGEQARRECRRPRLDRDEPGVEARLRGDAGAVDIGTAGRHDLERGGAGVVLVREVGAAGRRDRAGLGALGGGALARSRRSERRSRRLGSPHPVSAAGLSGAVSAGTAARRCALPVQACRRRRAQYVVLVVGSTQSRPWASHRPSRVTTRTSARRLALGPASPGPSAQLDGVAARARGPLGSRRRSRRRRVEAPRRTGAGVHVEASGVAAVDPPRAVAVRTRRRRRGRGHRRARAPAASSTSPLRR